MEAEKDSLTQEVKALNNKLDELAKSGRYMIYSANPFKFALFNFIAGIFHSLGVLFGTIIIAGAVFYFLSRINIGQIIGDWLQTSLEQVKWERIMTNIPTIYNEETPQQPSQKRDFGE